MTRITRNTRGWPVRQICGVGLLLLAGCAIHPRFPAFDAGTPDQALAELVHRRRMVESYFASTVFQFASPTGNIRLNGRVSFHQDGGWRVEFDGPLGVKLAVLETRDDRFRLKLPQAGQTIDGNLEEGLTIPDLEVNLPAVGDLTPLLLPTVDLNSLEDWRVSQAKVGNSGLLTLIKQGRTGTDSLVLSLDYSPVRVLSEEHWRKDHRLFKRELHYKTNPNYLPDKIVVKTDELMLCIKYKSMRLNLR